MSHTYTRFCEHLLLFAKMLRARCGVTEAPHTTSGVKRVRCDPWIRVQPWIRGIRVHSRRVK